MTPATPGSVRPGGLAARFGLCADTDGELLTRFVAGRDEEAFAALVARHGPLVLAVCRRVTADRDVADDAFQATFLVLARKAGTVRPRGGVRGWLYGVAVRTALRARTMVGRRAKREVLTATPPDRPRPPDPERDPDAVAALDEEVARLPDPLRLAVVLCELDGLSRAQAALRLGVAEGTLSSRLARARRLLADRLRARGLTAPAAGLTAVLGPTATVSAARAALAARVAVGAARPSAAATTLSREVVSAMLLSKLRYAPALVAGLIVVGALGSNPVAPAAPAVRPAAAPTPPPAPREPVLMLWGEGYPVVLSPDGRVTGRPEKANWIGDKWGGGLTLGRLSPDGTRVVSSEVTAGSTGGPIEYRHTVRLLDGKERPVEVVAGVRGPLSFWSRDGRRVYGSTYDPDQQDRRAGRAGPYQMQNWVVDLQTGKKSAVAVPVTCAIKDEAPDGKRFLTAEFEEEKAEDGTHRTRHRAFITTPGAPPEHRRLAPDLGDLIPLSFSPDGGRVLALRPRPGRLPGVYDLFAVDAKSGAAVGLNLPADEGQGVYSACWSPDGRRVAYVWRLSVPLPPGAQPGDGREPQPLVADGPTEKFVGTVVTMVDADGRNRRRIHTEIGERMPGIDWR